MPLRYAACVAICECYIPLPFSFQGKAKAIGHLITEYSLRMFRRVAETFTRTRTTGKQRERERESERERASERKCLSFVPRGPLCHVVRSTV